MKKNKHMELALSIAFSKIGKTSPNPAVGAVIVKNGNVIGQGGTSYCGGDHAEVCAIKDAVQKGEDLNGAEMYVTLEPCNHFGKTPPCTEAIISAGIKKVNVAILDPNPLVAGKGFARLRDSGVDVRLMSEYSSAGADLLRAFKKYILRKETFIINKSAITLDGRIATDQGDSRWISSSFSRYLVHKLRARVDAVIVGRNTFMNDDPALNVRLDSFDAEISDFFEEFNPAFTGRDNCFLRCLIMNKTGDYCDPAKVIIGLPENISPSSRVFADGKVLIFETEKRRDETVKRNPKLSGLMDKFELVILRGNDDTECVHEITKELAARGMLNAMLEGGGTLNGSFLDAGSIDHFLYFISPKIAGSGVPVITGRGFDSMSDAIRLHDVSSLMIDSDILYSGYPEPYNFEMM